ncbi:hypothetical protein OPIT5_01345 [Opitutaceae bacterium TAV5]|nr:hypothetical protein OPIT5_01345 [Opitutaceae bacterium TAV5]
MSNGDNLLVEKMLRVYFFPAKNLSTAARL